MVERVASVLEARDRVLAEVAAAEGRDSWETDYPEIARTVMAAMREPTEAMQLAAWADIKAEDGYYTWTRMIDEALK
jgi:hypothetical protein